MFLSFVIALTTIVASDSNALNAPGASGESPTAVSNAPGGEDARARANELLRSGNAAAEAGAYDDAIAAYEAAYTAFASEKILYNLARAYEAAGRLPEACDAFERFTEAMTHAPAATQAELAERTTAAQNALADLEQKVGKLLLRVRPPDATVNVDGRPHLLDSGALLLRLLPGSHELHLSKEGFLPEQRLMPLVAGNTLSLSIDLAPKRPLPSSAADSSRTRERGNASERGYPASFWWALGGTVVAIGTVALVAIVVSDRQGSGCSHPPPNVNLGCF